MFRVYQGRIHGWEKKFAMAQDVAMSASERGRGLFRHCLHAMPMMIC
ncbi:MAG: hypothetical protein R2847_10240 [Bacteroidia bacterium]